MAAKALVRIFRLPKVIEAIPMVNWIPPKRGSPAKRRVIHLR
jgi:hypothetical protein